MGRGERLHTHTHIEYMGTYHQPLILIGVEKREKDQTSADTRGLEDGDREREITYTRHRKEATIETQTKGSKGRVD